MPTRLCRTCANLPGRTGCRHPPTCRDGHGEAVRWVSSQLRPRLRGLSTGLLLAPWDGRCISWLADGSGTACSRLPPPPPGPGGPASVGMQHAVVQLRRAVPHCATPCRAKQQSSGLKARHRAVSTHTHAEGCGAELNLPLPSPHPPRCSMLQPRDWPDPCEGVPGGRQARRGGKGWSRLPPDQGLWSLACLDAATHT